MPLYEKRQPFPLVFYLVKLVLLFCTWNDDPQYDSAEMWSKIEEQGFSRRYYEPNLRILIFRRNSSSMPKLATPKVPISQLFLLFALYRPKRGKNGFSSLLGIYDNANKLVACDMQETCHHGTIPQLPDIMH